VPLRNYSLTHFQVNQRDGLTDRLSAMVCVTHRQGGQHNNTGKIHPLSVSSSDGDSEDKKSLYIITTQGRMQINGS